MSARYVLRHFQLFSGWLIELTEHRNDADVVFQYGGDAIASSSGFIVHVPARPDFAIPPSGRGFVREGNCIHFGHDLVTYIYQTLSYIREQGRLSYGNIRSEGYFDSFEEIYESPIVNRVFAQLKDALLASGRSVYFRNAHPSSAKASIALTHDVDYYVLGRSTRLKLLRNAMKALKARSPDSRILNLLRYCLSGKRIDLGLAREIEAAHGCGSSFNFSGYTPRAADTFRERLLNPSYRSEAIIMRDWNSGHERVVHPSICTTTDEERFRDECAKICDPDWLGGRQHMLALHFPGTFEIMSRLGYRYDTSIGFNDYNGYRGSNAAPHFPVRYHNGKEYGFIEYPLIFMDSVFTKQGVVEPDLIAARAADLAKDAVRWSMTGSICWHDVAFRDGSPMMDAYRLVLDELARANVFMGSPRELWEFHQPMSQAVVRFTDAEGSIGFPLGSVRRGDILQITRVSERGSVPVRQHWNNSCLTFSLDGDEK